MEDLMAEQYPQNSTGKDSVGERLHALIGELFPIARSITGNGLRATLRRIAGEIPLQIHEVPTGTTVLDWEVPREWNIRSAQIRSLDGRVLVDFESSNLHVLGYSTPVSRIISREELATHVYTLPKQPDLIPYRTGYYSQDWGFCLSHENWEAMRDEFYEIVIDSSLEPGSLTYGELLIPGEQESEVLISVHCCHPSLANDNLSGIAVATALARRQKSLDGRRLSYRFLFIPATIGSITWLARHEADLGRIKHGLVLTCVGDPGSFHYKQSRRGQATIDRATSHVLRARCTEHTILPFSPTGYDERQYCSPGYDLPVGCFMRSPNGTFPQYHTSADNLDFVTPGALEESYSVLSDILDVLDADARYTRVDGRGEPQLGRRGLYRAISGQREGGGVAQIALLWVLNLADGFHSLLDMAERSGLPFHQIEAAARLARNAGLIQTIPDDERRRQIEE
jgi:aminopeptidase-like protein